MPRKRIDIIRLQMIKENTLWYSERKINQPSQAVEIMREFIGNSDREQLILLGLNTKNEPTVASIISIGSLNASIVHPREIYKIAIMANSANIILGHNHPSGHPQPSDEDIEATKRVMLAGDHIGIPLLDHIIFTPDKFVSIREYADLESWTLNV